MIKTYLELLQEIQKKGVEEIKPLIERGIRHPRVLGDMYENITKEILEKIIFDDLDLRVVRGFIENNEGILSKEIDCMIVVGEGISIAKTSDYIWNIDKVIAIVQVKKKMSAGVLEEGFLNLQSVYNISEINENLDMLFFEDSYMNIMNEKLPTKDELSEFSFEKKLVHSSIMKNSYMPPRILFGFEGHKTEKGLRECFYKYIDNNKNIKGYSVVSFPDLIISGDNSLVKLTGMPYVSKIGENYTWMFYGSYNKNPLLLLLRIILERLSYKFKKDFTGNTYDCDIEKIAPYLKATPIDNPKRGWKIGYEELNQRQLENYRAIFRKKY